MCPDARPPASASKQLDVVAACLRLCCARLWWAGGVVAGRVRPPRADPPQRPGRGTGQATVWIRYDADVIAPVDLDQVRLRDFAGSVPWRRWRSHHGQAHLSGSYWAATTGGHVVCESRLELARLLLADFDPQVAGIWAQPCRLVATVDGRQRQHVPDFLLASPTGEVSVVNVKPANRLADPKVLENVRFLAGYRRPGIVAEDLIARAWREVRDGDVLGEVEWRLAGGDPGWTVRPALLALLWRHRLTTDLSRPLSGDAILRRQP